MAYDPKLLAQVGVTPARLEDVQDYRQCQEVGGALAFLGYGGVLVPSARHAGGTNLVIYPTLQPADDEFEVVDSEPISP